MREADSGATGLTGGDLNGRFAVSQTSGTDPEATSHRAGLGGEKLSVGALGGAGQHTIH